MNNKKKLYNQAILKLIKASKDLDDNGLEFASNETLKLAFNLRKKAQFGPLTPFTGIAAPLIAPAALVALTAAQIVRNAILITAAIKAIKFAWDKLEPELFKFAKGMDNLFGQITDLLNKLASGGEKFLEESASEAKKDIVALVNALNQFYKDLPNIPWTASPILRAQEEAFKFAVDKLSQLLNSLLSGGGEAPSAGDTKTFTDYGPGAKEEGVTREGPPPYSALVPMSTTAPSDQKQKMSKPKWISPLQLQGKVSKDIVFRMQKKLKELGLYDGIIDGWWGKDTQTALDKYKSDILKEPTIPDLSAIARLLKSDSSTEESPAEKVESGTGGKIITLDRQQQIRLGVVAGQMSDDLKGNKIPQNVSSSYKSVYDALSKVLVANINRKLTQNMLDDLKSKYKLFLDNSEGITSLSDVRYKFEAAFAQIDELGRF